MNSIIHKFDLTGVDSRIEMPAGALILSANYQDEILMGPSGKQNNLRHFRIWALVDPDAVKVKRLVYLIPTGVQFDQAAAKAFFVSTIFTPDGLVFHIFAGAEIEVPA